SSTIGIGNNNSSYLQQDAIIYHSAIIIDLQFTIDVSGSMAGSKIKKVIESMLEIISLAGPNSRIGCKVFNTEVKTLFGLKQKSEVDIERLCYDIMESVGDQTALYDAIIESINT